MQDLERGPSTGIVWSRIEDGWALNLDGTNASLVFTLPRIEVRSSPGGWLSECLHANGTRSGGGAPYHGGVAAAKADALAHARRVLAPELAALLRA
jgi:hypothetical protein